MLTLGYLQSDEIGLDQLLSNYAPQVTDFRKCNVLYVCHLLDYAQVSPGSSLA